MAFLIITSLIWGFSFGLIKAETKGLDPFFISFVRLTLSALVFLPFLKKMKGKANLQLVAAGFVQFGVMYCLYISSYQFLKGHQIAILTITTPLFVVALDAFFERRLFTHFWLGALLAIGGGFVLVFDPEKGLPKPALTGLALVQLANVCFAAGQVLYKRIKSQHNLTTDVQSFGWLYLGAVLAPAGALLVSGSSSWTLPERGSQWGALAYLGLIPSGLGFFLWNSGVRKVSNGVAAAMNNLKIPAGVLIAGIVFSEAMKLPQVLASLVLMAAALAVNRAFRRPALSSEPS